MRVLQICASHLIVFFRDYHRGSCDAKNASKVVNDLCIGQTICKVFADPSLFGDPCFGTLKHLAIQV